LAFVPPEAREVNGDLDDRPEDCTPEGLGVLEPMRARQQFGERLLNRVLGIRAADDAHGDGICAVALPFEQLA
jgi:hypothetical protein